MYDNGAPYGGERLKDDRGLVSYILLTLITCGIGPFIAMHILIKNSNAICNAYNRAHGL